MKRRRKVPVLFSSVKTGMVIVFVPNTKAGQLAPLIQALRESGLVASVQVFTEIIE